MQQPCNKSYLCESWRMQFVGLLPNKGRIYYTAVELDCISFS